MKQRLINATAVVKDILAERDKISLTYEERYGFGVKLPSRHGQSMRGGIRKALRCIETAPTVNAVEVVRCRDCIYFDGWDYCNHEKMEHGHCGYNDYCSYGERRTDNEDTEEENEQM